MLAGLHLILKLITAHPVSSFYVLFTVGAVLAGLPFSWVARYVAWWGAFAWLQALMLLTLVLKVLTRHVPYKLVLVRKKLE